jgi:hypothetical protein
MHTENTNRAQQLAAESAAASSGGSSMWIDGSGVPHILISGVGSTGSPVNAAETAAPWQPAPVSSWDAFSQGWRGDGWSVLEHGTQPKPFAYGLGGGTRAVVDSLTGAGAINHARQAFANGQNTRGVIYGMQGFGEAGLTAMSLGTYALAKSALTGTARVVRGASGSGAQGVALDWSRISARTGGDAAEHVALNHGTLSLTKPNQGVFYGKPVSAIEDAWSLAQQSGVKPVTVGNRDIYVVSRPNSGYRGGMGGQLNNLDHVTIITEAGTQRVVTGYPSGGTPPLPKGYNFLLGN